MSDWSESHRITSAELGELLLVMLSPALEKNLDKDDKCLQETSFVTF